MSDKNKKTKEKEIFESFGAIYPNFPTDEFKQDDETIQGRPDFWFVDWCIELTRYTYRSPVYRLQSQLEKIVRQAQQEFEAKRRIPLVVFFDWHTHAIPEKSEVARLATSVAELVAQHMPQGISGVTEILEHQLMGTPVLGKLKSMSIYKKEAVTKGDWKWSPVVSETAIDITMLEDRIAEKQKNIPSYTRTCGCSRPWLIIYDPAYVAPLAEIPDNVKQHRFYTSFDRVFFFDLTHLRIIALNTVR